MELPEDNQDDKNRTQEWLPNTPPFEETLREFVKNSGLDWDTLRREEEDSLFEEDMANKVKEQSTDDTTGR